jgi:hypothetical protein
MEFLTPVEMSILFPTEEAPAAETPPVYEPPRSELPEYHSLFKHVPASKVFTSVTMAVWTLVLLLALPSVESAIGQTESGCSTAFLDPAVLFQIFAASNLVLLAANFLIIYVRSRMNFDSVNNIRAWYKLRLAIQTACFFLEMGVFIQSGNICSSLTPNYIVVLIFGVVLRMFDVITLCVYLVTFRI